LSPAKLVHRGSFKHFLTFLRKFDCISLLHLLPPVRIQMLLSV
jgi:hypothetical protein